MSETSILVVGDTARSEFREARAALDKSGRVTVAADVPSAVAMLADTQADPDLIVVAQAYPGQFSTAAIDRLRRLAPLARVVGLLGSWCEGEMRTGQPWPAAIRIYWHQWLPQVCRELGRLGNGECSTWALPATATEEERLLAGCPPTPGRREGLIVISARQFDMHDWLSAACRRRGYSTVWLPPGTTARVEAATVAIFDGTDCNPEEVVRLRQLSAALGPTPIIALLDFPRIEDYARALAAGAAAVLSKPLLLEDLYWQMDQLLDASPPSIG